MRLSTLIKTLELHKQAHGDLEVALFEGEISSFFNVERAVVKHRIERGFDSNIQDDFFVALEI